MAWLGCPREHTVALETLRLNPPWILTLEPERSACGESGVNRSSAARSAQAACGFSSSASNVSPFFQIFSVMAAILRASVSRAIAGCMPLASSP